MLELFKGILLKGLLIISPVTLWGQLQISNQGGTAAVIVSDIIGQGLNVINPTVSCSNVAYGTFTNGAQIGIPDGIVLTTGNLNQLGSAASVLMQDDLGVTCNDPQLISLEPTAGYDCCILEFDIIPQCNEISIRFSMGSEEYPEYVNQSFNDAFGFFITGPNPSGGNYTNSNVALLNGSIICSIDNINANVNSAFYVDNSASTNFVFDAYTTAITSVINVIPCETYHFKLAIGDATDGIYDSGVFIDFLQCTNVPTLALTPTNSSCNQNNGQIEAEVQNGFPPMNYVWSPAPGGGQGTPTATGLAPNVNYSVVVSDNYSCTDDITDNATLVTSNAPIVTNNPLVQTVCSNEVSTPVILTSNMNGTTFSWTAVASNGLSGYTSNGTATLPAETIVNTTSSAGTVTYTITPSLNGCDGPPVDYVITVNPLPVIQQIGNSTVCHDEMVSPITFNSIPNGASYSWTNSDPSIGLAANGTGNIASFSGVNTSQNISTANVNVSPVLNGCIGNTMSFQVIINPVPVVNSIANIVQCAGTEVESSNFMSTPVGATFTWSNDNVSTGLLASGVNNISTFTLTNSTTNAIMSNVDVVPTLQGCTGLPLVYAITVNPGPTTTAGSNTPICQGEALNLTADASTITGTTYEWSGPNLSSTDQNPTIDNAQPNDSGDYEVTVTANGCSSSSTTTVEVIALPITIASSNSPICQGEDLTLFATSSDANATFSWTGPFVPSTDQNPVINDVDISNSGDYMVTISIGTCSTNSTVNVIVNPLPVITAFSNTPICEGDKLELAASSNLNGTYLWYGPSDFTSDIHNPTITDVGSENAGEYMVIGDAEGCKDTVLHQVVVTPIPSPVITTNSPLCEGEELLFSVADAGNFQNFQQVSWIGPNFQSSTVDNSILNATIDNSGSYAVEVSINGCTNSTVSDVVINPIPQVDFLPSIFEGCAPLEVNFEDLSAPEDGEVMWDFGDGETSNETPNVSHTFLNSGCYDVQLNYTSNGCSNSISYADLICVFPNPDASFIVVDTNIDVMYPNYSFINQSTGAIYYDWTFGDGNSSNELHPTHTYPDYANEYFVTLTVSNDGGCTDVASVLVPVKDILLFYVPNTFTPDNDSYNDFFNPVFYSGVDDQNYTLLVFNRWGQVVFESHDPTIGWNGKYGDKIAQDGTYTWKLVFKDNFEFKKHLHVGHVNLIH